MEELIKYDTTGNKIQTQNKYSTEEYRMNQENSSKQNLYWAIFMGVCVFMVCITIIITNLF